MKKPLLSTCHNAPVYVAHGCDSDFGHGGKKCDCAEKNKVVTCWYECSECKEVCSPIYPKETWWERLKSLGK